MEEKKHSMEQRHTRASSWHWALSEKLEKKVELHNNIHFFRITLQHILRPDCYTALPAELSTVVSNMSLENLMLFTGVSVEHVRRVLCYINITSCDEQQGHYWLRPWLVTTPVQVVVCPLTVTSCDEQRCLTWLRPWLVTTPVQM